MELELDVNKIIDRLGAQISQLSIQNAALQSQVEALEEMVEGQKGPKTSSETVDSSTRVATGDARLVSTS